MPNVAWSKRERERINSGITSRAGSPKSSSDVSRCSRSKVSPSGRGGKRLFQLKLIPMAGVLWPIYQTYATLMRRIEGVFKVQNRGPEQEIQALAYYLTLVLACVRLIAQKRRY